MSGFSVEAIHSVDRFAETRTSWNQLWSQSEAYEPLSRCEGVQLWHQQFTSQQDLSAILVWDGDRLVGGLPLIHSKKNGIKTLVQPANSWANAGELLIDSGVSADQVARKIIDGLMSFPESVLCFDHIRFESSSWAAFLNQLNETGSQFGILREEVVGLIEIGDDWDGYFQSLSGNHRSAVRRSEKKARKLGQLSLLRMGDLTSGECETWMRRAFEIEHKSWKAENGSSILASDGMSDYFLAEAELARQAGMLELWFLTLDDQPIAFEYCHRAKDVCLSYKIGYDEAFQQLGPGRLLRKLQLELLHQENPGSVLDTKGILCPAKAKWVSQTYSTGRLMAAVRGRLPKFLLNAYLQARPVIQKIRGHHANSVGQVCQRSARP